MYWDVTASFLFFSPSLQISLDRHMSLVFEDLSDFFFF